MARTCCFSALFSLASLHLSSFFFIYLIITLNCRAGCEGGEKKENTKGNSRWPVIFILSFFILSIYVQLFNWWEYPINTSYCLARPLDRLICNEKKAYSNSFNLLIIQSDPNENSFASKFGNQNNCKQSQITVN